MFSKASYFGILHHVFFERLCFFCTCLNQSFCIYPELFPKLFERINLTLIFNHHCQRILLLVDSLDNNRKPSRNSLLIDLSTLNFVFLALDLDLYFEIFFQMLRGALPFELLKAIYLIFPLFFSFFFHHFQLLICVKTRIVILNILWLSTALFLKST